MADIRIQDHGSVLLLLADTDEGEQWLEKNIETGAMRWGKGIVAEPRFVGPIIDGAKGCGLTVTVS